MLRKRLKRGISAYVCLAFSIYLIGTECNHQLSYKLGPVLKMRKDSMKVLERAQLGPGKSLRKVEFELRPLMTTVPHAMG